MNQTDEELQRHIRESWPECPAPSFDTLWSRAEQERAVQRRRYAGVASIAAAAALAAIIFGGRVAIDEPSYIEVADLLDTTYWTAPSDTLMPEYEFDIYQEMPVLFEST